MMSRLRPEDEWELRWRSTGNCVQRWTMYFPPSLLLAPSVLSLCCCSHEAEFFFQPFSLDLAKSFFGQWSVTKQRLEKLSARWDLCSLPPGDPETCKEACRMGRELGGLLCSKINWYREAKEVFWAEKTEWAKKNPQKPQKQRKSVFGE